MFGQLTDITGSDTIFIADVRDTEALVRKMNKLYPLMNGAKYVIAVDKKIVSINTRVDESSNVALLPPFSGG